LNVREPARRTQERGARLASLLLAIFAPVLIAAFPDAAAEKPSRDDVQAAYLYNFGKFVRWPGDASHRPMLVCVAGEDPFGETVRKLVEGEQIDGRPLEVRNLDRTEGVGDCSILFIGAQERDREGTFLSAATGKPILTVGDSPDFLERGGMIQFVLVEDHVRFAVNLEECNRHRVGLSSELLKVAAAVTAKSAGGAK
jgi:hypothetical protein